MSVWAGRVSALDTILTGASTHWSRGRLEGTKIMLMILLALLLLAVTVVVVVAVVLDGSGSVAVDVFGLEFDTTVWGVFVAGVVTGLVALAGLAALAAGVRRIRARREEIVQLRRKVAEQEQEQAEPQTAPDETLGAHRTDR
ncbi:hypothetical protein CLV30_11670 [Haloactinopolyspora alba]|uniref:Uncharacterized protein n=2 Tax=Haloactinopolyspora alba TaxID=648780 RepID=A0A2P8DT68_9ACTN|nr:hypothetical protein CLV30_11670 [Haloactinopolyspora alba]